MTVAYDGSNYHGYQKQGNLKTIEKVVDDSLEKITKQKIKTYSSGRTDKGVHALGQVFSFSYNGSMNENNFKLALNSFLPLDIRVVEVIKVQENFHARYSTHKKEYRYFVSLNEYNLFYRNLVLYEKNLNLEKMSLAISKIVGTHDFRGFSKSVKEKRTIKTIFEANINYENNLLCFKFVGDGFLKYMVRSIVGTLLEIGKNKKDVNIIEEILNTRNRQLAGKTVEPIGLYLWKVYY